MDKTYSPEAIEPQCYQEWEKNHYFAPQPEGDPFCIMLPPPNVTGSLHMGHGFQHTLIDAFIRYQRMNGASTLWQPGVDHAGISTQLVVEAQIERTGSSRQALGREAFLEKIWAWKHASGGQITQQMRRLGTSADWTRERFTLDPGFSAAVQKVFIQLHDEGLIYRGTRLVNWDPVLETAVSDLEVIASEEPGHLWHIRYPVAHSTESIIVATTRPETLLGDTAVAVHPDDIRYQHLIGLEVQLPLCNRTIPIIADPSVDPTFGTGAVKITPAHDFNDYEMGKRHQLPLINIFTIKAVINKEAPTAYQGLTRETARTQILHDLETEGFLVKTEPHTLKIPRGEKSNTVIEPFLTTQWYVKTKPLAEPAMEAVRTGNIQFIPENWSKTYFQWMENIEDWCISRQLWWGHQIPAWYDEAGNAYVGYSENDVRFKYQLSDALSLKQDEDVLDTWFSSALWPFVTLGWPEHTEDLARYYPTSVLFTGFDIIFFWVARMIMMGLKFMGKVPFRQIFITGLVCDADGKKMSKSKGNVIDPLDVMDGINLENLVEKRTHHLMLNSARESIAKSTRKQFPEGIKALGADALRFTYCALASNARVVRFDLARVEGSRNFCNKLWNAARYVLLNTEDEQLDLGDGAFQYSAPDRWIASKLQSVIEACHRHFEHYRFDLLASTLYDFVWHEYCDWYLELSKPVLYDTHALPALKRGTRRTLVTVLNQILKLLHPLTPFITEAIWQRTRKIAEETEESIMLTHYPVPEPTLIDVSTEQEIDQIKRLIQAIRTVRSELEVSPAKPITLYLRQPELQQENSFSAKHLLAKHEGMLMTLAKLTDIQWLSPTEVPPPAATAVIDTLELFIPIAGLIDPVSALSRLTKTLAGLDKEILSLQHKLENKAFCANAPAEVLEKNEQRLKLAIIAREKLLKHQHTIQAIA